MGSSQFLRITALFLAIASAIPNPVKAQSLIGCIVDRLRPKTQNSTQPYDRLALRATDLNHASQNLETHFSDVRQDFVGGGGRPFALQGLPPFFEVPQLFLGRVVRASEVQNVFKNGIVAATSGGEIWTTTSPVEALQYGIKRGTEWKSNNPDDKWVIVVMRVDRSKLGPDVSLSRHVRPHENPNSLYTRQDIPSSAISHVFVLDPTAPTGNSRFRAVPNPALSSK
jgi:hypothetical protein